ncbi:UDP-N-acetylmuramoyl-L-alanyl-D-glutamate--2,6-diaminopimelate ligase [Methylocapsa polymorpha]|uniref:UDP-N-acetylmuramoyl-L-alanyl-D-glutamate--2,6-diaminopimelate ligase n=1 Tax=Methylocapsa polymorpha TaxID=3080828 RepID=A0ABZ0HQD0_9HYPH|nr:UDP-N-acetylmuramoyl-L-alanyl-D-glutamate--2,6-diaminopimelate ligase [Methylocapsa sp. RX1]
MRLAELLPSENIPEPFAGREVKGVAFDSRAVTEGAVFFAVPGTKADGLAFAAQAAQRGAIAIVAEREPEASIKSAAFIKVDDARSALARAAARLYPRQPETIVAITGTSGKTSVAAFARQIWAALGASAASLGTLGVVAPSGAVYGSLTTPDPVTLHKTLDELARSGVTHLALEASSHGIAQRRLDGVRLAAAGFTNLSRDHLDYHATLEDYLDAKMQLFDRLLSLGQTAVVDADSDVAERVISVCEKRGLRVFSVGWKGAALRLLEADAENFSTRLRVAHAGVTFTLRLPLAGAFQASNALVAAGLCIASGSPPEAALAALERLEGAPGRLELVGRRNDAPVFVDYAHKPDALDKVLRALRPFVTKRLIVVFGCGGDRDAGKRPIMGEVAARLADRVIVTDDNPRSEEPAAIRKAILAGAVGFENVLEIGDRAAAIAQAVAMLEPGDGLLIAGKGHETGQIIGDRTLPFSDSECARAALKEYAA